MPPAEAAKKRLLPVYKQSAFREAKNPLYWYETLLKESMSICWNMPYRKCTGIIRFESLVLSRLLLQQLNVDLVKFSCFASSICKDLPGAESVRHHLHPPSALKVSVGDPITVCVKISPSWDVGDISVSPRGATHLRLDVFQDLKNGCRYSVVNNEARSLDEGGTEYAVHARNAAPPVVYYGKLVTEVPLRKCNGATNGVSKEDAMTMDEFEHEVTFIFTVAGEYFVEYFCETNEPIVTPTRTDVGVDGQRGEQRELRTSTETFYESVVEGRTSVGEIQRRRSSTITKRSGPKDRREGDGPTVHTQRLLHNYKPPLCFVAEEE